MRSLTQEWLKTGWQSSLGSFQGDASLTRQMGISLLLLWVRACFWCLLKYISANSSLCKVWADVWCLLPMAKPGGFVLHSLSPSLFPFSSLPSSFLAFHFHLPFSHCHLHFHHNTIATIISDEITPRRQASIIFASISLHSPSLSPSSSSLPSSSPSPPGGRRTEPAHPAHRPCKGRQIPPLDRSNRFCKVKLWAFARGRLLLGFFHSCDWILRMHQKQIICK